MTVNYNLFRNIYIDGESTGEQPGEQRFVWKALLQKAFVRSNAHFAIDSVIQSLQDPRQIWIKTETFIKEGTLKYLSKYWYEERTSSLGM